MVAQASQQEVHPHNKGSYVSLLVGAVSYALFILIVFSGKWQKLISIFIYPFLFIFPELNSPNAGMAGLPFFLLSTILSIFAIPVLFWLVFKLLKIKVSVGMVMVGFLSTAVAANIVKLLSMLVFRK